MNANGSEDIVWFAQDGEVQYLELFPVRPNLLSHIDNGIGFVQDIQYTTAAQEMAEAKARGAHLDQDALGPDEHRRAHGLLRHAHRQWGRLGSARYRHLHLL